MEKTEKIQAIKRALETRKMLCVKFEKTHPVLSSALCIQEGEVLRIG